MRSNSGVIMRATRPSAKTDQDQRGNAGGQARAIRPHVSQQPQDLIDGIAESH